MYIREKGGLPPLQMCENLNLEPLPCHPKYFGIVDTEDMGGTEVKTEARKEIIQVCRGCGRRAEILALNDNCGCCFCRSCNFKINLKMAHEGLDRAYCPTCKKQNYE